MLELITPESPQRDNLSTQDDPTPVIETRRLSKRLRGRFAVRNVSITVQPGQVYGLLGAAGAGKTTFVKLLLGFLHPDGGQIHLFGPQSLGRAKMRVGYLPQRARYHTNISGRDYLRFHAGLGGLNGRDSKRVALEAEEIVGLGDIAKKRIGSYSKEQIRRLGLAVGIVSGGLEPPDLLILDEPTVGLGDELGVAMRDVLLHCRERGSTILICSKDLTSVERLCTHVGILRAGRLIAQTPVDPTPRANVVGLPRDGAMEIAPDLIRYLRNLHSDASVEGGESDRGPLHVSLPTGSEVPRAAALKAAAMRAMLDARWDIISVYEEYRDLDSLFLQAVPLKPKTQEKGDEKDEVAEEAEKAEAPAAHSLTATSIGSITSPLSAADALQSPGTGKLVSPPLTGGPSTQPLQALAESEGGALSPLTPQLEPRKVRDRSNGATRPVGEVGEGEKGAGEGVSKGEARDVDAALAGDGR